ncbi:MAG: ABC transporter substrate-binding protein [Alphaproteobacteria bacterium]|nr:ABC transporter substrate-binding protein [Alphaproteobacteria bacterium]
MASSSWGAPLRSLFRLLALVLVGCGLAGPPALAQQTPAAQFVKQLGDQAISVLQNTNGSLTQREARFRQILSDSFDVPFIGRFVLGRHWTRATAEQQGDYLRLFQDFLVKTYSSRLGGYSGETLVVVAERDGGNRDTVVRTRIDRPSGPPIDADWRIRQQDAGFRIIDIEVAGISMALTQRSDFDAVVQRNSVAGLIEVLRARTTKMAAVN